MLHPLLDQIDTLKDETRRCVGLDIFPSLQPSGSARCATRRKLYAVQYVRSVLQLTVESVRINDPFGLEAARESKS